MTNEDIVGMARKSLPDDFDSVKGLYFLVYMGPAYYVKFKKQRLGKVRYWAFEGIQWHA